LIIEGLKRMKPSALLTEAGLTAVADDVVSFQMIFTNLISLMVLPQLLQGCPTALNLTNEVLSP